MIGTLFKKSLMVLFTVALCVTFVWSANNPDTARRGDYPQCQQWCLDRLEKRMAEFSEDYKRTGDRLLYEGRVEQARLDYDDCITNCKMPIPVK